ncbi:MULTISPECIES: TetR family transcriptional regulator [unclassified Terrabacter]|uniref:TetR/AcrR family transcriptional regulator n=1 Tax=unclassified Terrabacter TaxID=2630222 RepID=UPI0006F62811|nr:MULTISPECIES: TetR family transcriptional regulator [unclassified Terrabacter]KRB43743.1 transcriptional regulator [Terrabacter sp. Root181]KRF46901.1 transcriptional regulator [Terrabacter sp. Soil810]
MTSRASSEATPKGRGRRPGGVDTRAAIVDAARKSFAAKGYDKASMRGIAREAGVDPALVHHYFEGKAALFAETLDVPVNPAELIERITAGDVDRLGWRIVETFLTVWEPPERRDALVALVRSSMTSEEAARMLREFLGREVFGRIAASTGAADPQLRGALAASQMIGLVVARYVIRVPAMAEATREELVERIGPVLQHHLVDRLPEQE